MRAIAFALVVLSFALGLAPLGADAAPKKGARILMVTQSGTFRHEVVTRQADRLSPAEQVVSKWGVSSGLFRVEFSQDAAKDFTKERLDACDIVFFYTTGNLPIPPDVLEYFLNDWLKQEGHGFIGVHSATDTYNNHRPYWEMIGATFAGHPWNAGDTVSIRVHDTKHPAAKPWGEEFEITDEIYQFRNWQPEKVRVLMSLDMAKTAKKAPHHIPIAWVRDYGKGKVFYLSLGHREDVWTNPTYEQSILGAIRWMLGQEEGDATPNPEVSTAQQLKAQADVKAAQQ